MALEDDISVLDDGTRIYKGETRDRMLDEALAMALETECEPLYPDTPIERMYDAYFSYDCTIMTLEEMGEYPLCEFIKDKEGRKLRGAKLVQYVFSLHGTEISPEQADAFVPFLYQETIANVGDGTDDEPDNQFDIDVKDLFESQDFWGDIKAMYDYYTAIEPHLLQELDKMHDLHPETNEDKWVTLNDLKALLFVYKDFPSEELEPFFEKCRHGRPRQVFKQRKMPLVYFYHKYFEYIYTAVKAAKQAVSKELEPIKEKLLRKRQQTEAIPQVSSIVRTLVNVCVPIDKAYRTLDKWAIGKTTLIDVASAGDKRKNISVNIIAKLEFTDIEARRPITPFDRRVLTAVSNLKLNGQDKMTETQIHKLMGGKGKPNREKKAQIRESVETLLQAWATLDNREEASYYKSRKHFEIKGNLIHGIILDSVDINGQIADWAVHVFVLPYLFQFALSRNQYTTIPLEIMQQSALSNTPENINLKDYIYYRVSRMKATKLSHKIKYDSLYRACNIDTRMKKTRLKNDKLPDLLNELTKLNWIKGYTKDKDGVTIKL